MSGVLSDAVENFSECFVRSTWIILIDHDEKPDSALKGLEFLWLENALSLAHWIVDVILCPKKKNIKESCKAYNAPFEWESIKKKRAASAWQWAELHQTCLPDSTT